MAPFLLFRCRLVSKLDGRGKPRGCRLKSNGATPALQRGQQTGQHTKKSCGARITSAISRVSSQLATRSTDAFFCRVELQTQGWEHQAVVDGTTKQQGGGQHLDQLRTLPKWNACRIPQEDIHPSNPRALPSSLSDNSRRNRHNYPASLR